MYIVYGCKKEDLQKILESGYILCSKDLKNKSENLFSWLDEFPENIPEHSNSIFLSIIFDTDRLSYRPSKEFSYLIFKPSVIRESLYWSPSWHALEHLHYPYNKAISIKENLKRWREVFLPYLKDYNPEYTYSIYNIPQNQIVFKNKVSLKYLQYIIE